MTLTADLTERVLLLSAPAVVSPTGLTQWFYLNAAREWRRSASELPSVSDRAPVLIDHFPDALHAVVWRNWGLVEPDRLASVLGTTPDALRDVAGSMGLPRQPRVPAEMLRRGYITLIRRNWHLLPYEQLTELVGMTPSELAFTLREDDFLYVKLGSMKPHCEPVRYAPPAPAAARRAAQIQRIVQQHFGDRLQQPQEDRFGFVRELSEPPSPPTVGLAPTSHARIERPRFIYSYFALFGDPLIDAELDPYPDGLLARLQASGVNGVWLHVVLRQLAPGGPHFPEWGEGRERRLANLRALVERAGRHGIDVYLYMNEPRAMPLAFFADRPDMAGVQEGDHRAVCTSHPAVREWLRDSLAHVFREVPNLGGIFTITASENLTNCASHGGHLSCPRCRDRSDAEIIAEVNAFMTDGIERSAPDASVFVWDWGWKGHGDAPDIIAQLPEPCWLMSVSEWSLPLNRGGVPVQVGEYSISAVGPGPRATRHWRLAKNRGLKTVAKVQLNNSWELSSVPYLPVMDLVAQHVSQLAAAEVDGLMLSWSLGGYPSPNLELASRFTEQADTGIEPALDELAARHFGERAVPHVRQAWTKFSRAFQEFPYDGAVLYKGPQQMGPANLLYAAPTGYTATMVGLPYDDLHGWRGPYPVDVFIAQFEAMASGWSDGLADLAGAQPLVRDELRAWAEADLRVARAAGIHFASVANQAKFVALRDREAESTDPAERRQLRQELIGILEREIELARQLFRLASADSRLGYEASNHYYYIPSDLVEKVVSCVHLRRHYHETP